MFKKWFLYRYVQALMYYHTTSAERSAHFNVFRSIRNHFRNSKPNFRKLNRESFYSSQRDQPNVRRGFNRTGLLMPSLTINSSIWHKGDKQEDLENNLAHLVTLARIALERGDVDRAETILDLAVKTSEEHNLHSSIIFMYDVLATIAISQGDVAKAEKLLVCAIEKLTQIGFEENNHNIVDFKLRLARIYSVKGENSLANIGFQNCMNQQRAKIVNGDYSDRTGLLYVNVLFWYGVHKHKNNQFADAKKIIKDAYEYSTKIKGITPKQEMVLLYILSEVNFELGDYEVALTSLKNAIVLGNGFGSVDIPVCYLKLGNIYQRLHYDKDAKKSYEEARRLAKTYGFYDVVNEADLAIYNLEKVPEE